MHVGVAADDGLFFLRHVLHVWMPMVNEREMQLTLQNGKRKDASLYGVDMSYVVYNPHLVL